MNGRGIRFRSVALMLALTLMLSTVMTICLLSTAKADSYSLWIGGTQVNDDNRSNLSENHWSYNPSTHTLTLSGYSYSGEGYNYSGNYYAGIYYRGTDSLTLSLVGANSVTQTKNWGDPGDCPIVIDSTATLSVTGSGSLNVQQGDTYNYGPAILSSGAIVINGGTVKAVGGYYNGIKASSVTVKSTVTAVDVKGTGGSAKAVDGTLINEIAGIGYNQWNQSTKIEANNTGATLTYQHVVFPIAQYTLRFDANGGSGSMDDVTVEEGESYTLPDCGFDPPTDKKFNWWNVHGMDLIGIPGTPAVIASNCADENGVVTVKALWIDMDKAPAATVKTAPEAENLTYSGQKQALVTAGEAEGGAIWYAIGENETDVPDSGWSKDIPEGTNAGSYYVWYRAAGDNSHRDSDAACCEAGIDKAANPATVTGTATVIRGGNTVDLAGSVTLNDATGAVGYEISGDENGCLLNGSVLTSGDTTGSVTVNVTIAEDDNYYALAATTITVTVIDKKEQTITASDVTATYGDTDKAVSAATDGNGAISYAVKDGSGDYIDVNASTGALTIKTVPADGKAYVTVTAAETADYAGAVKDVAVTINKANAAAAAVTANNRTYDGTEMPLVTVDESTLAGGKMYYYALGTDAATAPAEGWSASVPTAVDAGTYYAWYKAMGDANHLDSEAVCITVQIAEATETCVITFDANGGKGEMEAVTVEKGTAYTLPKCGFTAPTNRKFSAWDKGAPGKEIEITEDTVIKAQWAVSKPAQGLLLPPKLVPSGKTALEATWNKMNGAEGYDVHLAPCGSNQDAKLYKSIKKADKLSCKITGLASQTCYRVWIRGWIKDDSGKKIYLNGATEQAHAITGGSDGKQTTPESVSVKPSKVSVEVGKKETVQATVKGMDPNLPVFVHSNLTTRWYSTDESVAKVDDGTIKGVKEGSCTVWAVAINGVRAKVSVEVTSKGTDPGKKDIGEAKISKIKDQTYTGKEITPKLTVKYNGKKLKEGTDYTVKWKNNKKVGTATGTVKGTGDYKGNQKVTFKIVKKAAKPKAVKLTSLKAGKKELTVKWEKGSGIDGYQIEYSLKEDFSESEKVTVKDAETTSKKLKELKKGKTYYVRVRTYKKTDGKTNYSKWSETLKKKTK